MRVNLFHHFMKTGGSSVWESIINGPGMDQNGIHEFQNDTDKWYHTHNNSVHYSVINDIIETDGKIVTVLRDPLQRIVSLYNFRRLIAFKLDEPGHVIYFSNSDPYENNINALIDSGQIMGLFDSAQDIERIILPQLYKYRDNLVALDYNNLGTQIKKVTDNELHYRNAHSYDEIQKASFYDLDPSRKNKLRVMLKEDIRWYEKLMRLV